MFGCVAACVAGFMNSRRPLVIPHPFASRSRAALKSKLSVRRLTELRACTEWSAHQPRAIDYGFA